MIRVKLTDTELYTEICIVEHGRVVAETTVERGAKRDDECVQRFVRGYRHEPRPERSE